MICRGTSWGVGGYFYIDVDIPCGINGDDMGEGSVNALPIYMWQWPVNVKAPFTRLTSQDYFLLGGDFVAY